MIHDGSAEVLAAFPQVGGAQAPVRGTEASAKTDNTYGEYEGRTPSDQRDGGGDDTHAVETAIARLRAGLGTPKAIQTVVKRGYRLALDAADCADPPVRAPVQPPHPAGIGTPARSPRPTQPIGVW